MQRLIVEAEQQLSASFCIELVNTVGKCEVIPMTGNFCVVEGFNIGNSSPHFERLLKCIQQYTIRALLANANGDLNLQLQEFLEVEYCGMYTEEKPPFGLWSVSNSKNGLYHILPWNKLTLDDFDTVC